MRLSAVIHNPHGFPSKGDATGLWKTETTAALPGLDGSDRSRAGHDRDDALLHRILLRLGTNGNAEDITL